MILKINQYIKIRNPKTEKFVSAKVIKVFDNGYELEILGNGDKRKFSKEFLEQNGFKIPTISKQLIEKLGFIKIDDYSYKYQDIFVVLCYISADTRIMITDDEQKYFEFIDAIKKIDYLVELADSKKNYKKIIRVEELFLYLNKRGIDNFIPSEIFDEN